MSELWHIFKSGQGQAAWNMAIDETLLEAANRVALPVLRFYSWSEPAATFGYSQRFSEIARWTALRPLIRRPTGGGLVPHDSDWTYSLVVPPQHAWYEMKALDSYRQAHQWIQQAFELLEIKTLLAPCASTPAPGQCFVGAEKFDVLREGVKIAGAAQRRNRLGLLIQGSIQLRDCLVPRDDWEEAMCRVRRETGRIEWAAYPWDDALGRRAAELAETKYTQPAYNERR